MYSWNREVYGHVPGSQIEGEQKFKSNRFNCMFSTVFTLPIFSKYNKILC